MTIVALVLLAIWCISFPIQERTATYALNEYLVQKDVSPTDIYKVQILKDYKVGGYSIFVRFKQEMTLSYEYAYSFKAGAICLRGISVNEYSDSLTGGIGIGCDILEGEKIYPIYEPDYYSDLDSASCRLEYDFVDFSKDVFAKKLIFEPEYLRTHLYEIIGF